MKSAFEICFEDENGFNKISFDNMEEFVGFIGDNYGQVDAYLDLPVGYKMHCAINGGELTDEPVIVFKALQAVQVTVPYLVVPAGMGRKLARKCAFKLPKKMTVLADTVKATPTVRTEESCSKALKILLEYIGWFNMSLYRVYRPLPVGLKDLYDYLCENSDAEVGAEEIKAVNDALGGILNSGDECRYTKCSNLNDYTVYLGERYKALTFKKPDFTILRTILKQSYPDDSCYF